MWDLTFITEEDFRTHVTNTINEYGDKLIPYNLKRFNNNIVDPIKLIFDKAVYNYSWEEIINNELFRQRDKSSNNDIGYFHQRIFSYMKDCTIPATGWDVVFIPNGGIDLPECGRVSRIYVEMKNKHNTMNSSSSAKTYMKMQGQLLEDDDCACMLVEAIAKKSANITWQVSVDGAKQKHRRIRRVSMDEFYSLVTGEDDAFYKMCMALPKVINSVGKNSVDIKIPKDTVYGELEDIAKYKGSLAMALYMLGFSTYKGF